MITREFNLYLHAGHSIPLVINVNQYDRGETWVFTLFNADGTQYIPSSGAIVGIKSDNLGIINAGEVDGLGRVLIDETEQMTAAVGKAVFELLIDDQTHGTANFVVLVEPKPGDNADLSESDYSLFQQAIDGTSATAIAEGVADWMDENLTPTSPVVDASLTVQGAAADSAKVGQELSDLKSQIQTIEEEIEGGTGSGLTEDIKQALLDIVNNIPFIGDDPTGQTYITALQNALYPPVPATGILLSDSSISWTSAGQTKQLNATLTPSDTTESVVWSSSDSSVATVSDGGLVTGVALGSAVITATAGSVSATCSVVIAPVTVTSISAVYTQSGTVYDTDSLDSLKADLVVTASWSNGTTSTLASSEYTLSGTLSVGTSTITASYAGLTDTFDVTVSEETGVIPIETVKNSTLSETSAVGTSFAGTIKSKAQRARTSKAIRVKPGDVLSWSISGVNDSLLAYFLWFDANQNYTGVHSSEWSRGTLTITDQSPYVGMCFRTGTNASNVTSSSAVLNVTITKAST